ncbi:MAG: hypothetical protein K9G49_06805 [Taibaiella sp.]|nr:hypothetical protein [Taibaiella sp.]
MRFLIIVISIAVLCGISEFFLPWWMAAVVPFLIAIAVRQRPGGAFLAGFSGVGLCWLSFVMLRDIPNAHLLSTKMAQIFQLPGYGLLIVVTVFIGALIGGMAAWAGALIKR